MIDNRSISIAYETVQRENGELPLLVPMSEVAGRMAVQNGAKCLEANMGGMGKLLSGVPGVEPATVTILGGGIVGMNAAKLASGLGAKVYILDVNPRITSTFKMYNDICNNNLLKIQLDEEHVSFNKIMISKNIVYGYIHLFAKESFFFKQYLPVDNITNLPKDEEYIKKGDPIFSIYLNALTEEDLVLKFREKISILRNYYNFYDIVI